MKSILKTARLSMCQVSVMHLSFSCHRRFSSSMNPLCAFSGPEIFLNSQARLRKNSSCSPDFENVLRSVTRWHTSAPGIRADLPAVNSQRDGSYTTCLYWTLRSKLGTLPTGAKSTSQGVDLRRPRLYGTLSSCIACC